MTLANATTKLVLFINEVDYSDYLVDGNISDDSVYAANIITSRGNIKLAGDTTILDYNKTLFPIGSKVTIYATLDNGKLAKLPRGHLYVLNSSMNVEERSTTLEVGCSLAYLSEREGVFTDEVAGLFSTFVSSYILDSFVIQDFDLSTLETLLEIEGRIIFQDRWGNIQSVEQFGSDGLGSNILEAKLTSFDKKTAISIEAIGGAIEDIPSAVLVEASVEIPKQLNNDDEQSPTPPPFLTSETIRNIKRPDVESYESYDPKNDPDSGQAELEAVPNCGTLENPNPEEAEVPDYAYTIKASVKTVERDMKEKVVSGRYVSYQGVGNQVDFEYDFEWCSAITYANDLIRGVVDIWVNTINGEVQKANALLSKANQAFATRDDYGSRPVTVIRVYENGQLVSATYDANSQKIINAYEYYACAGKQYYDRADDIGFYASIGANDAVDWADGYRKIYGFQSINVTFNSYGKGGELVEKVQYKYIHNAATEKAKNALAMIGPTYSLSPNIDQLRVQLFKYLNFLGFKQSFGRTFDSAIRGDSLPTEHTDNFRDPERYYNVKLASKTVTVYNYGSVYTTETETFTDYENPDNNYTRANYSSSGSKNATEEDRIEIQKDGNGCIYVNEEASNTENKELSYKQEISVTNPLGSPTLPVSWLGTPEATIKTVQLPLEFAPVRTKTCAGVKYVPNLASKMNIYSQILQNYTANLVKKITSDNFGFRITERGTRAELFEYYPFYPIALNLTSLEKGYKLRAASSNWVFDANNVLCSFDCFNVGNIDTIPSTEVTPSDYMAFSKTEVTTVLDNGYFNLPETADSIEISVLPTGGVLAVSGVTVNVGDTISVADINAGNVTFTV